MRGCPILAKQGWDGMISASGLHWCVYAIGSRSISEIRLLSLHHVQLLSPSSPAGAYSTFENQLERVRHQYRFVVAGYVLMPEHVHLLVGEPQVSSLATALQVLKQRTSNALKRQDESQFWQRRYYDFNVRNPEKTSEKLRYMHRNPVKRTHGETRRLAMVEFSALCDQYGRNSRDRVDVGSTKAGAAKFRGFPPLNR